MTISLVATCASVSSEEWNNLMRSKRKCSYKKLCAIIKKCIPDLYEYLRLDLFNPYHEFTYKTKRHYILTHSFVEYFFEIN